MSHVGPLFSPFDELGPHPLAREAAEALKSELRAGGIAPGLASSVLEGPGGGKMFGVLVAEDPHGRMVTLRAFSGMLAGRWRIDGFVPPIFDAAAREAIEPAGEAVVKRLLQRAAAHETSPERQQLIAEQQALTQRHADERTTMRARHEQNRHQRHSERAAIQANAALDESERRQLLHSLDQQSRGDKAEKRRLDEAHLIGRIEFERARKKSDRRQNALERLRQFVCRRLMQQLHDTYLVPNAHGERRSLRELYPSGEPPSGAGDCAAPKLLAQAYASGLRPLALAEFWWGTAPTTGGRVSGEYYPACRDKCGPLLPYMLQGLEVAPPRTFEAPSRRAHALPIVYEDEWLVVVDKPSGLLSIPGKDHAVRDSVLERIRESHPRASGPMIVHRLDLDTSGLLVIALDPETHGALQKQFLRREVQKRYVAVLDGVITRERGTIDFPMRVDLNDRPRQIHDPVHGKRAITDWEVMSRDGSRTRVALFPRTGRTHQLRVHSAHPTLGLNAPIVGDRLYGRAGERLMLHAEVLAFTHPATGEAISFERPAPF